MKWWTGLLAGLAVLAATAGGAAGGEYHYGSTLICNDCHVLHSSTQHGYTGSGGATSTTPQAYALKASSPNAVCLSCHDGQAGIPDVVGLDANQGGGPRQAGALTTGATPYEEWKGHTLGSAGPPPGGSWPGGETVLQCVSCHTAHGNTNYRNLGGKVSGVTITYAASTSAGNATDVRIDLPAVPAVGSRVSGGFYSAARTFFNNVKSSSPYAFFCAGCHTNFHGASNTNVASPFKRHPTERVGMPAKYATQYASKTNKVPVMFAGNAGGATYDTTAMVSCMSCHKAHGNQNTFALIYMKSTGTLSDQGVDGGTYRDLCGQCHVEGN